MKKIILLLFLTTTFNACYEEYIYDYNYDGVYFPYQLDVRTFVVGEGMRVNIGVSLGGVRQNKSDRIVEYTIDESLITSSTLSDMKFSADYIKNSMEGVTALKLLPENYYTASPNSLITIKKGKHSGTFTLTPDSVLFLTDSSTLSASYILPLRIVRADADTVIPSKNYAIVGLKYENKLFGNYWHGGVTVEKDVQNNILSRQIYYTTIPSPESKAWKLTTVGPFSLVTNGVSDVSNSTKPEFKLTLEGTNVNIESVPGATHQVFPDGPSTFNDARLLQNRKLFLNYKYMNAAGNWCYATDTLTFRNRIRDGVNEWQDENSAHY